MSYYRWLIESVASKESSQYTKLLTDLYAEDFIVDESVPMDHNREIDGIDLRSRYADEHSYVEVLDILETPCTMLEMLVAIAIRVKSYLFTSYKYSEADIFWEMLHNIGLDRFTDARYDYDAVMDIIDILCNREYDYDGRGGALFIVDNPRKDMRDTDIWYQMNWYYADKIKKGAIV